MRELYGQSKETLVILHGGAGGQDPRSPEALFQATDALRRIALEANEMLRHGMLPQDVVVRALEAMELDEQFNAGKGSSLQADGQARLTAALMNGETGTFSGVIGAMHLIHPSALAKHLQTQSARVLTSPGTELLARELGLPVSTPVTTDRIEKWQKKFADQTHSCDTVGVLIRTSSGALYAGTSTGGRGFEFPGRVSDSATVAGTYASRFAAISATGVGEEIVDDALAARLETRRRDGLSLEAASTKCFAEANAKGRMYGWIAVDTEGFWAIAHTTPAMSFAVFGSNSGEIASSRGNGPL